MEKKDRNSYCELSKGNDSSITRNAKRESRKGKENKELRILNRGKIVKERSFSGDGVSFRAKIIGTEQVLDARGNRMCQGALQRLKAAVKTSGDHKRKIILNISLDGIIIKDEKTGDPLHHHPIHKISFISQDTKDGRAFGYVYGCPQSGHSFFAIKTEKTASQVVVTLRDLFLVALEMKKSELERTQNLELPELQSNGKDEKEHQEEFVCGSSNFPYPEDNPPTLGRSILYSNIVMLPEEIEAKQSDPVKFQASDHSLLDLQSEVDVLQQGISQIDHSIAVTQSFGFPEEDLTPLQSKVSSLYQETLSISSRSSSTSDYNVGSDVLPKDVSSAPLEASISGLSSLSMYSNSSVPEEAPVSVNDSGDKYAVFLNIDSIPSIFDDPTIIKILNEEAPAVKNDFSDVSEEEEEPFEIQSVPVAFAELDPLGNQPYVDKRDFFQDIKNPPKKVLKDLASADIVSVLQTSQENMPFSDMNEENGSAFEEISVGNPPKLPPKRVIAMTSELGSNLSHTITRETINPFNPFLCEEFLDIPPPSSPPPPPPPRLLTKACESPLTLSPPPPRPPSRISGVLTPPLPKRKVPLNSANRTWFSFDQDASLSTEMDPNANNAPPLPSPARKLPSSKPELLKSSSASNSPATLRRLYNRSPGCSVVLNEIHDSKKTFYSSPRKVLSRHTSIFQDNDIFPSSFSNPFTEAQESLPLPEVAVENSPPLPPKPVSISQVRSSPLKQGISCTSSYSSSSVSVIESSSGTRSSSSLVFSSLDENVGGTSSEALFSTSTSSHSDVFSHSSKSTLQPQSSNGSMEDRPSDDASPDSIFRRKSDPFADDFFLSLQQKSIGDSSTRSSNSLNHFDNLKVPT